MKHKLNKARELKELLDQREQSVLSPLACLSAHARRRYPEPLQDDEYRQAFSADADRILNSLAFTRYTDKPQVFSLIRNDHITHRVLHVQLVSRVARTIGRYLNLNQDLIEAASLGHDIGHPPFGHDGERFLSKLTRAAGAGSFLHNIQSIQFLDRIERRGKGWNLALQTMDAIVCHNGEVQATRLSPASPRSFDTFDRLLDRIRSQPDKDPVPMTLEGCVVRMADSISYVGRDLEDGIRLGLVSRDRIPDLCKAHLGQTNGTIVFNLVTDLILNSLDQPCLQFSDPIALALETLKRFNYAAIYQNPAIKRHLQSIEEIFKYLFDQYLSDLETENRDAVIFKEFLFDMEPSYVNAHSHPEIVRDFISGMTDSYFIRQAPDRLAPEFIDHV